MIDPVASTRNFDHGTHPPSGGSLSGNDTALLQRVREAATSGCFVLFRRALDAIDDSLFGFSEKSDSATERSLFLDAMRNLRVARPTLEQTFADQLAERFTAFVLRRDVTHRNAGSVEFDSDALSLVEENDLEEDLAIDGMIAKAQVRHHSPLYALQQRLAVVVGNPKLEIEQIPFGPAPVCQALRAVARKVEADITVKLVVFKVLDRQLVVELDEVYDQTNKLLAAAGVLPHIKFTRPPRVAGDAPTRAPVDEVVAAAAEPAKPAGVDAAAEELVAALAHLLASRRRNSNSAARMAAGPSVGSNDVIAVLSKLQARNPAPSEPVLAPVDQIERVKQDLIEELRRAGVDHAEHRVAEADEDSIDLVAMLFQFVVQDRNLPAEIQAALARLQIPFVRVAVKDRHLFAQRAHPARKLLDTLAGASVAWSRDGDRDGRFLAKLEATVDRVVRDYADDFGLFGELDADFGEFLEKQKRQAEAAEQRATDAALGREKLSQARRTTTQLVATRIGKRQLPPLAREVLLTPWTNYMVLVHVREGVESPEWKRAVNFIDAVIWATLPKANPGEIARLQTMLPQILANLRSGLARVGFGENDSERLAQGLDAVLRALHQRDVALEESAAIVAAQQSLANAAPAAAAPAADDPADADRPASALDDDDEYLLRVRSLRVGTWVEFATGGSAPERAKISWISPFSARLLFVNRRGLKVAERSVYVLAEELRAGTAQILEVAPIFERALNSIMSRLKYEHLLASGPAAS